MRRFIRRNSRRRKMSSSRQRERGARAVRVRSRLLGAWHRGPDRRWRRASRAGSCVNCRSVGDVRGGARFRLRFTGAHAPNAHKVAGRPAPPLQCPHHAPRRRPAGSGRPQRRRFALGGGRHVGAAALRAAARLPPRQRRRVVLQAIAGPHATQRRVGRLGWLSASFGLQRRLAPVRATGPLVAPMPRPAGRCAGPAARVIVTPSGGLPCHGGPTAAWVRAVVVGMGDPPRCA